MNPAPFANEGELRSAAVALARHACNGDDGRVLGDPVFDEVTEGRARWPGYSACGDLAHFVLSRLGFRDERVVNRNDDGGTVPWRVGANLSRLVYRAGGAFVWARPGLRPKPGDILYVAAPEHVCVLEAIDDVAAMIATFDYGQWDAKRGKPAGRRCVRPLTRANGVLRVGSRSLRGWLDISRLPGMVAKEPTENRPEPTC